MVILGVPLFFPLMQMLQQRRKTTISGQFMDNFRTTLGQLKQLSNNSRLPQVQLGQLRQLNDQMMNLMQVTQHMESFRIRSGQFQDNTRTSRRQLRKPLDSNYYSSFNGSFCLHCPFFFFRSVTSVAFEICLISSFAYCGFP